MVGVSSGFGVVPAPPNGGHSEAPRPGVIPLRPLAGGEVMAAGAAVVRRHFWTLGPLAALGSLVAGLIQWGVLAAGNSVETYDKWAGQLLDGGNSTIPGIFLASAGLSYLFSLLWTVLLSGVATVFVSQDVLGRPVGDAFRRRLGRRWFVLLAVAAAVAAAVAVGTALFVVPGVLIFLTWSMAAPVAVMEGADLGTAVRRSASLTLGGRGRILGLTALALVASNVAAALLGMVVMSFLHDASANTAMLVSTAASAVAAAFATAWLVSMLALTYVDLRMRKERLGEALWAAANSPEPAVD